MLLGHRKPQRTVFTTFLNFLYLILTNSVLNKDLVMKGISEKTFT